MEKINGKQAVYLLKNITDETEKFTNAKQSFILYS